MVTKILYAQPVFGNEEIGAVVKTLKDGWLGNAKKTAIFEQRIARIFGKRFGLFVNSGTSANMLAIMTANLPEGAEVITQACTFPSTLSPILLAGLVPVFIDAKLGAYNIDLEQIEKAIGPKTRGLFISHILGNLNDMSRLHQICKRHNLILIEDSCDAIGATFAGRPTGAWSDITTTSFYATHHITAAGGGGMFMTDNQAMHKKALELRDWGRKTDKSDWDINYSELAYNFKPLEIQAAFGLEQFKKINKFNQIRKQNFQLLYEFFKKYEDLVILPEVLLDAKQSWLAFPVTLSKKAKFNRRQLVSYLTKHQIQTRPLFAGNILRHKAYKNIPYRVVGKLTSADWIMDHSLIIGCHQGLGAKDIGWMCKVFENFFESA